MDRGNSICLEGYLNSKLIEEAIGSGATNYRPAHLARSRWCVQASRFSGDERPRRGYLLCIKLAGLPAVHLRVPRWVSLRLVFS